MLDHFIFTEGGSGEGERWEREQDRGRRETGWRENSQMKKLDNVPQQTGQPSITSWGSCQE